MALSGTEYLRSMPSSIEAYIAAVSGDELFVVGRDWTSITNMSTVTTRAFQNATAYYIPRSLSGCADVVGVDGDTLVWTGKWTSNYGVFGMNTAGGAWWKYTGSSDAPSPVVGHGDYVGLGNSKRLKVSTWSLFGTPSWNGTATLDVNAKVGSTIYSVDSTNIRSIDPAADTYSAVLYTLPVQPARGRGATIGNTVHFIVDANSRLSWDSVAGTHTSWGLTPVGAPAVAHHIVGPDGYLYSVVDDTYLLVVDPATGRWAKEAFPTVRSARSTLAIGAGAGKIWVPASTPDPWP